MKRCLIGLVAAVAVLMMTCPSMAQQRRGRGERGAGQPGGERPAQREGQRRGQARGGMFGMGSSVVMTAIDVNRDGELSVDEIAGAADALKKLDKNGDGKLSREELRPPTFAERLMQMDKNENGKIEKDEVPERMQQMFDRLDANGDGAIDKEEVDGMMERMRQGFRGRGGARGEGGAPQGDRPQRRRRPRPTSDET